MEKSLSLYVKKITVTKLENHNDKIIVTVDLPYPYNKTFDIYNENDDFPKNLSFQFSAPEGIGAKYVKKHFNIEPDIIDLTTKLI